MIELDKRIISGKKPLTCFDAEQARNFVGEKCYLTNDISLFSDLDVFKDIEGCKSVPNEYDGIINTLSDIDTEISMVFETTYLRWKFCIPCEWVKQKSEITYEPYTLETFENEFSIGDVVTFRGKSNTDRAGSYYKCVYSGYRFFAEKGSTNTILIFGLWGFSLSELFDLYEINRDGKWQPFGILDK